jgi:hypothetical protein
MKGKVHQITLLTVIALAFTLVSWNALALDMTGLVLYVPFESANPADHSPDPTDVSVMGGTLSIVAGKVGNAALFDGTTYIEAADADKLDGMEAMTIQAWIDPEATDGGVVSKRIAHQDSDSYNLFMWQETKIYGRVNSTGEVSSETVLLPGQWYHVALVFDGTAPQSERQKLYVNGVLEGVVEHPDQAVPAGESVVYIGELSMGRGFFFKGLMDEVSIWARALSEAEINEAMGGPLSAVEYRDKLTTVWGEIK